MNFFLVLDVLGYIIANCSQWATANESSDKDQFVFDKLCAKSATLVRYVV